MSANIISEAGAPAASPALPHQSEARLPVILVVDDRAINREFLVTLLKYAGYQTVEASSPTQLPDMDRLDLIISDVHMPGMNGLAFLNVLRADTITRHVPVILYTAAYKTPEIDAKAKALGVFAVLTKPTAPEVILDKVREAISSNAHAPAGTSQPTAIAAERSHLSATLIEIMLDLATERDPEKLLPIFCYGAKELIGVREASVHIVAPVEDQGHIVFSTSASQSFSGNSSLPCDCGLVDATRGAKGRCLRNIDAAKLGIVVPPQTEAAAMLYVPIATSANHLGCLCLADKIDGKDFDGDDERYISTLAIKLAVVYDNIRIYKELERFATRVALESEARARTQEELDYSRQEQVRLKDEFLSHVSHELRSPVMVVQQFLEILQEDGSDLESAKRREYIDIALRNTNQLNSMISDLLEATRIETGKLRVDPKSMALPEVLNEGVVSATLTAKQKRITVSLNVPETLPLVVADRSRVRQILTNLLDNAIKFTPENGVITVHAGVNEQDPKFVQVDVTDTGCGISQGEASKVFDRLYQVPNADSAARKGLGLGLCICKQLVVLQGGQISVKSQSGPGSTFSFTLPVFSMSNVLLPILGEDALPESIALLTVEVCDPGSVSRQSIFPSLRETIERCVLPGLDAIMPDTYDTHEGRMFVILARTDERGAQVLGRRLEDQLKLNQQAAELPCPPRVRLSTMDLSMAMAKPGLSEQREAAAAQIEQNLKKIIVDRS